MTSTPIMEGGATIRMTAPFTPRGRPRYNRQLNISVTEEMLEQLKADAVKYDLSQAEIVRFYIREGRRVAQLLEAAQEEDIQTDSQ